MSGVVCCWESSNRVVDQGRLRRRDAGVVGATSSVAHWVLARLGRHAAGLQLLRR